MYEPEKYEVADKQKYNIEGKLAQAIIDVLFTELGYIVHHSGMENTFPGFGDIKRKSWGSITAKRIRWLPDFICMKKDEESKEPLYIEVKFSGNGRYNFKDKYRGEYPYPEVFFILVSPTLITAQKVSELEKDAPFQPIDKIDELGIDERTAIRYNDFCKTFFGGPEKTPQGKANRS
jgi:hypothetical protein